MKYVTLFLALCVVVCESGVGISPNEVNSQVVSHANATNPTSGYDDNNRFYDFETTTVSMTTSKKKKRRKIKCTYYGGQISHHLSVSDGLKCCKPVYNRFKERWHNGGYYLTSLLETLKTWQCPEFMEECKNRTFAFTDFTKMVYDKFCHPQKYQATCRGEVLQVYENQQKVANYSNDWSVLTSTISSTCLTDSQRRSPCIQVALFESNLHGHGYYHETVDIMPFCGFTWCGFDSISVDEGKISTWSCMQYRCRVGFVLSITVCVLLGLAITISNITVIVVFYTHKNMRNSQAIYKVSLAIADLLVGAVVFPTFISTLQRMYLSQHSLGKNYSNYEENEIIMYQMNVTGQTTPPRMSGGFFNHRLSSSYLNFVGVFTSLSLMISIYTLMIASFDRLLAVSMPLKYSRHSAKLLATWATIILWAVAMLFAILPVVVITIQYSLVASILVAPSGTKALILFSIAFIVPLIFVWLTTIATYLSTKKHAHARRRLTVTSRNKGKKSLEQRLAKTLAIMVGVFTLTLCPTAIILIVAMFVKTINYEDLENLSPTNANIFASTEFIFVLILMTNSLWNCYIYNARSDDFKKAARRVYGKFLIKVGLRSVWDRTLRLTSSRTGTRITSVASMSSAGYNRKKSTTLQTNLPSMDSSVVLDRQDHYRRISSTNSKTNLFDNHPPKKYHPPMEPINSDDNEEVFSCSTIEPAECNKNIDNSKV